MARCSERPGLVERWHRRLYRALYRRELAAQPHRTVDGVELYFPEDEADAVEAALTLLRAVDPRRYRRLQAHLCVLTSSRVGTHYDATADVGCIDVALEPEPWPLAAALVHEATHAWLLKVRGVPYEGAWRAWHERRCLREERCFLRRALRHAGWPREAARAYLGRLEHGHREALARAWWEAPLREQLRAVRWHRHQVQSAS